MTVVWAAGRNASERRGAHAADEDGRALRRRLNYVVGRIEIVRVGRSTGVGSWGGITSAEITNLLRACQHVCIDEVSTLEPHRENVALDLDGFLRTAPFLCNRYKFCVQDAVGCDR
jgi:hypothetical protein